MADQLLAWLLYTTFWGGLVLMFFAHPTVWVWSLINRPESEIDRWREKHLKDSASSVAAIGAVCSALSVVCMIVAATLNHG